MPPQKVDKYKEDICVCILAHNEQKHIASTIKSIINGNRDVYFDIVVYANGCTDDTTKIVKSLIQLYPNLRLRELEKASKSLAWNTAFQENNESILLFADGDVEPEADSVFTLYKCIMKKANFTLASCQYWPQKSGLSYSQKFTGLLQIPLVQDFLTGCFYAVKKINLENEFEKHNISGIPDGIVGEDYFIELLVPEQDFTIVEKKCFYEPPVIEDYLKYLARMRWQEKQIESIFGNFFPGSLPGQQRELLTVLKKKLLYYQGAGRLLLGILTTSMRSVFIFSNRKQINMYYQSLGDVVRQGESILSKATRSSSAK